MPMLGSMQVVVPIAIGQARVEGGGPLGRSVFVYGSTSELPEVLQVRDRAGQLPAAR